MPWFDDYEIINEFQSVRIAFKHTNINDNSIRNCCIGKQKTAGGYKWESTVGLLNSN